MKLLQCNVQSVNTSSVLLQQTSYKLQVDIILLQEIWHPESGSLFINNYPHVFTKVRQNAQGGGVAIIAHKDVKCVRLNQYEVDGLEAVWADVMVGKVRTVIGSIYIPPGDFNALRILEDVLDQILKSHSSLILCMDANSRNVLWDDKSVGISPYSHSVKMGYKLEEIILKYSLLIHNDGVFTYNSGNSSSAPDVTLSTGILQYGTFHWSVIDYDLRSPHNPILIDIGARSKSDRKVVINWRDFDWQMYEEATSKHLSSLYEKWITNNSDDVEVIARELSDCIQLCVESVATKKVISNHSRPYINSDISEQLKLLRRTKRKCRLRKSPANVALLSKVQQDTTDVILKAK